MVRETLLAAVFLFASGLILRADVVRPGGMRRLDVESFSFAIPSRARFWKGNGGDLHPDAIFLPPKQFELEPGAIWTPPTEHFYVCIGAWKEY